MTVLVMSLTLAATAQDKMKMMKPTADEQALMMMERTAWANLIDKKYDNFDKLLADDYQGVYPAGTMSKAEETAMVRKMTFKTADVSDLKVMWIDKDAAIITAIVKADIVDADGKANNQTARTMTVATKRGGKWLIVYHSDFPVTM